MPHKEKLWMLEFWTKSLNRDISAFELFVATAVDVICDKESSSGNIAAVKVQ